MARRIWMQPSGLAHAINLPTEEVPWRLKIRKLRGVDFNDDVKQAFLASLQRYGKVGLACVDAGCSLGMYQLQREKDEEFREAVELTLMVFKDKRIHQLEAQAMSGHTEPIFGANGEVGERKRFESGLRAMILKAYAPEMYKDVQELNVNHKVGAVIVPAVLDPDDWEAQFVENQAKFESITTEGEEAERCALLPAPSLVNESAT